MGVITGRAAEKITLLHYNDCCSVEGAARFLAAVKEQKENNPLVLFSGNIFSPSMSKSGAVLSCAGSDLILSGSEHRHEGRTDDPSPQHAGHSVCSLRQPRFR